HRQLVEVVFGHLRARLLEVMRRRLVLDRFRSTNGATELRETQRTGMARGRLNKPHELELIAPRRSPVRVRLAPSEVAANRLIPVCAPWGSRAPIGVSQVSQV